MNAAPVTLPPSPAAPESFGAPRPGERPPILSPATRNPGHLLWVWTLPQVFLLLMNVRSLGMIWGEMSEAQRVTGRWILGSEIAMLVGIGAFVSVLRRSGKPVSWALQWPLFAVAVAYLWLVFMASGSMIPASVSLWILPPQDFLYYQFAFVMPAAFFAAMQLACFETKLPRGTDIGLSLATLFGVPFLAVIGVQALSHLRLFRHLPETLFAIVFLCGTILAIGALLRLVVMAYVGVRRKGPVALAIFTALVALAAPLGGLFLNRKIPFPADFQSLGVYALAALNGVVLLLPNFRSLRLHRAVWLAQCALFPFTLYFFVVFLPFLPLSLLAMIVMGAGFLILTPTALFVLHGQRILDGYRNEVRDGGRLLPALLGTAAVLAIPAAYTAHALHNHAVLSRAVDHAYTPDYRASGFRGNPASVGRALLGLRDFKSGIQLPFLSDYYNWLVFDGLVLPDEKMAHLHRLFLGREMPEASRRMGESLFFGESPGRSRRSTFMETRGEAPPPPQEVLLEKMVPITEAEDSQTERTRITLTMRNTADAVSEFATTVHVPEGVLVSGFWLHIGPERVPGRIFEKKTALWVYQKIRDVTRRDPGILLYTGPETLDLRVYPFAARETRTVELEFLRPVSQAASVQIGKETFALGDSSQPKQIALAQTGESGAALVVPPGNLADLPRLSRQPYLHFIVDRSASSTLEGAALRETLVRLAGQFPAAKQCAITAANFDAVELTSGLIGVDALAHWDPEQLSRLPRQGGFAQDRALKRVLLRAADDLRTGTPEALSRFPLPIIVRGSASTPVLEGELAEFGERVPDVGGYFVSVDGGALSAQRWDASQTASFTAEQAPHPVVLFKTGGAIAAATADRPTAALMALTGGHGELQVWGSAVGAWKPVSHIDLPSGGRYARGAGAWLEQKALVEEPSLGKDALRRLVALSRATGVIVPATSYIVVENSAQWRKLEETEKKKLANNAALELEETPEPSTALLLACGGAALLARRRRGRKVGGFTGV